MNKDAESRPSPKIRVKKLPITQSAQSRRHAAATLSCVLDWIWDLNVIDGPLRWIVMILAIGSIIFLVAHRASLRWHTGAGAAAIVGWLLGALTVWVVIDTLDVFGGTLLPSGYVWVCLTFSALGLSTYTLISTGTVRRKAGASAAALVFALTGAMGVNASFGMNETIGSLMGINTNRPILPPKPLTADSPGPTGPLHGAWVPPSDLPSSGAVGPPVRPLPSNHSRYSARGAELYLPPAALADNAPALPFMIFMNGKPGSPEAAQVAEVLDSFQAEHDGLAPIVLVVDQLGDPPAERYCVDSSLGNFETYLMQDVVPWVRSNLRVLSDPQHWVMSGYSNGGACAAYFGAKYPEVWGNIIDISGNEYPGQGDPKDAVNDAYAGDEAAFEAAKPSSIMAQGAYPDTFALFTVGSDDRRYIPSAKANAAAARKAGMDSCYYEVPHGDHTRVGLNGGLRQAFKLLYPRLGLSQK